MLLLMFRSGGSLFGVDAKRVVEVVPRVGLRVIPHALDFLLGLLSYRGMIVPMIDFGLLTGTSASREALSTRAILIEFTGSDGSPRIIGLVAENVSHVVKVEDGQIISPPMSLDEARYLGAVVQIDEGLVQLVDAGKLLPDRMQDALYGKTEPD